MNKNDIKPVNIAFGDAEGARRFSKMCSRTASALRALEEFTMFVAHLSTHAPEETIVILTESAASVLTKAVMEIYRTPEQMETDIKGYSSLVNIAPTGECYHAPAPRDGKGN